MEDFTIGEINGDKITLINSAGRLAAVSETHGEGNLVHVDDIRSNPQHFLSKTLNSIRDRFDGRYIMVAQKATIALRADLSDKVDELRRILDAENEAAGQKIREQERLARAFDDAHNEGSDGYNPFRDAGCDTPQYASDAEAKG